MKKFIALVAVVGFAMAFVACGKKAETAETPADTEEQVVDSVDSAPMDTAAVEVDSASAQ
jgi:PBP1b-binding outer membrane lipoprotein LpoB